MSSSISQYDGSPEVDGILADSSFDVASFLASNAAEIEVAMEALPQEKQQDVFFLRGLLKEEDLEWVQALGCFSFLIGRRDLFLRENRDNLTAYDFRGAYLANADLEGCSFINTSFKNANLRGANLKKIVCTNVKFNSANMSDAKLFNVTFDSVDMSGADIDRAVFDRSDLKKVAFGTKKVNNTSFIATTFKECTFKDGSFNNLKFKQAEFDKTILAGKFRTSDFTSAEFHQTGFSSAVEGGVFKKAKFGNGSSFNSLVRSKFVETELGDTKFTGSICDCSFKDLDFSNVGFKDISEFKGVFENVEFGVIDLKVPFDFKFLSNGDLSYIEFDEGSLLRSTITVPEGQISVVLPEGYSLCEGSSAVTAFGVNIKYQIEKTLSQVIAEKKAAMMSLIKSVFGR